MVSPIIGNFFQWKKYKTNKLFQDSHKSLFTYINYWNKKTFLKIFAENIPRNIVIYTVISLRNCLGTVVKSEIDKINKIYERSITFILR